MLIHSEEKRMNWMLRNLVICVMEVLISDTCWLGLVPGNFDIYAANMRCSNVVFSKINAESPYQVPSPAVYEKSNMFFFMDRNGNLKKSLLRQIAWDSQPLKQPPILMGPPSNIISRRRLWLTCTFRAPCSSWSFCVSQLMVCLPRSKLASTSTSPPRDYGVR